jgi:hypothetical protein
MFEETELKHIMKIIQDEKPESLEKFLSDSFESGKDPILNKVQNIMHKGSKDRAIQDIIDLQQLYSSFKESDEFGALNEDIKNTEMSGGGKWERGTRRGTRHIHRMMRGYKSDTRKFRSAEREKKKYERAKRKREHEEMKKERERKKKRREEKEEEYKRKEEKRKRKEEEREKRIERRERERKRNKTREEHKEMMERHEREEREERIEKEEEEREKQEEEEKRKARDEEEERDRVEAEEHEKEKKMHELESTQDDSEEILDKREESEDAESERKALDEEKRDKDESEDEIRKMNGGFVERMNRKLFSVKQYGGTKSESESYSDSSDDISFILDDSPTPRSPIEFDAESSDDQYGGKINRSKPRRKKIPLYDPSKLLSETIDFDGLYKLHRKIIS